MSIRKAYMIVLATLAAAAAAPAASRCLVFDGVDDHVYIDNTPLKMQKYMTLEFWFRADSFARGAGMIDNGTQNTGRFSGYAVCTDDSNRLLLRLGDGSSETTVRLDSIPAGRWMHFAFSYDRYKQDENITVYLNGRAVRKADCHLNLDYPFAYDPYGFFIGKYRSGVSDIHFRGAVDELRIWSYVRSHREIAARAAGRPDSIDTRLKGYYTFDADSGNVLRDLSPSRNHGELRHMQASSRQLSYAQLMTTPPSDVLFRRIVLTWDCSYAFDAFSVDVSADPDFSASLDGFPVQGVSASYYILDDIEPGTYYYRVKGHYEGTPALSEPWSDTRSVSTVSDVATPVCLSAFSAGYGDHAVQIVWTTESQTENAFFVLQRREKDGEWKDIHRREGAGTNNKPLTYRFSDTSCIPGKRYQYRLLSISFGGAAEHSPVRALYIPENAADACSDIRLDRVYPNPFNPRTRIAFSLRNDSRIRIALYSAAGTCVDVIGDGTYRAGRHETVWEPGGLPAGVYILQIRGPRGTASHKLLYMK